MWSILLMQFLNDIRIIGCSHFIDGKTDTERLNQSEKHPHSAAEGSQGCIFFLWHASIYRWNLKKESSSKLNSVNTVCIRIRNNL